MTSETRRLFGDCPTCAHDRTGPRRVGINPSTPNCVSPRSGDRDFWDEPLTPCAGWEPEADHAPTPGAPR